jgi:F-type H+-transporting ATPase subunit b
MPAAVLRIAILTTALVFLSEQQAAAEEHGSADSHAAQEHAAGAHGEPGHDSGHGEAHGEAHGGHGELHLKDVLTNIEFIGSVVNFAVLLGILIYFGRKPLGAFLVARRKEVEEGLAEAARLKKEAEAKYKEYSERLEKLDEEIKRMTDAIAEAAQKDKQRIIEEAGARAQRLKQDTERLIEQQMKQLQADVMHEVVDSSVKAAESVLRDKLNAEDQQKLARDYATELGKSAKEEGRA